MDKKCYLFSENHEPTRARFPVIDAHNHLWAAWDTIGKVVDVMDANGVLSYCDLTANIAIHWGDGGYKIGRGSFEDFLSKTVAPHPNRFYGFSCSLFAAPKEEPLFTDADDFVKRSIELLQKHVSMGARGLKVLKELGLFYRDGEGELIAVDDPRLFDIWEEAGRLGVPVLIHQSDPYGFFEPVTEENEHYDSLIKYPDWSFCDARFPSKDELLARRDNLVNQHPNTTFLLPHGANFVENLAYVDQLLEENPNVYIDFSARCDELGRQPYTARDFIIKHQDRVYFGTDMPASNEMYRFHWRFFETYDEWFIPPDYDGTFGRYRWHVCGLGLPDDVLRKFYYQNALKLIPGLKEDLGELNT